MEHKPFIDGQRVVGGPMIEVTHKSHRAVIPAFSPFNFPLSLVANACPAYRLTLETTKT